MELNGCVGIVTGCTGGLGQRICRALAGNGAHVAGVYRDSRDEAEPPTISSSRFRISTA